MSLGTLCALLTKNLSGKGTIGAGKGVIRAGYESKGSSIKMPSSKKF